MVHVTQLYSHAVSYKSSQKHRTTHLTQSKCRRIYRRIQRRHKSNQEPVRRTKQPKASVKRRQITKKKSSAVRPSDSTMLQSKASGLAQSRGAWHARRSSCPRQRTRISLGQEEISPGHRAAVVDLIDNLVKWWGLSSCPRQFGAAHCAILA
jgi:hypothetical protein